LRLRNSESIHLRIPLLQCAEADQIGVTWSWRLRSSDLLKLLHRRPLAIVECVWISSLEVDQPSNPVRVRGSYRTQFGAGDGVPHQHGSVEFERVNDGQHVVTEAINPVLRG